tara:strand:- start:3132 stop:3542 length:411 start_codon:yes stop_codon:yes gene_type:complete
MSVLNILLTIIYLLLTHFISDFIMQSDEMAKGKSTSIYWLTRHVFSYCKTFFVFAILYFFILILCGSKCGVGEAWLIVLYIFINSGLHWVTDYFTSKQVKKYFDVQNFHIGFVVIGIDQFIHATTLILTFYFIFLK